MRMIIVLSCGCFKTQVAGILFFAQRRKQKMLPVGSIILEHSRGAMLPQRVDLNDENAKKKMELLYT